MLIHGPQEIENVPYFESLTFNISWKDYTVDRCPMDGDCDLSISVANEICHLKLLTHNSILQSLLRLRNVSGVKMVEDA